MDTQQEADPQRLRRIAVLVSAALVVVTAAFTAFFGWSWWSNAHDESLQYARDRDDVLRLGQPEGINVNTRDARNVDDALNQCLNSAAGRLHHEFAGAKDQSKTTVPAATEPVAGTAANGVAPPVIGDERRPAGKAGARGRSAESATEATAEMGRLPADDQRPAAGDAGGGGLFSREFALPVTLVLVAA